MSTISNISSNLLNLLSSDSSKNSSASDSSSSSKVSSSKTDDLASNDLDTYISTLKSNQATLADYMGDSSSSAASSDSLYSVLNYNVNGKVDNIIHQLASKEEAEDSSSSTSSTDKVSST